VSVDKGPTYQALIDISTPITVVNRQARSERLETGPGEFADYQLLIFLGETTGDLRIHDHLDPSITRFIFQDVQVFDLPLQNVGLGEPLQMEGIIGGDLLTRFVVSLHYGTQASVSLGDSLADTDQELSADCDERVLLDPAANRPDCSAVLHANRYGGGTMLLGDQEMEIPATRLVLGACMAPDAFNPVATPSRLLAETSGVPVSALVSTGFGVSVIARSAFERLKARRPELVESGQSVLYLPNGEQVVSLTKIPVFSLVDDLTEDLGPCLELARRRRLLLAHRDGLNPIDRTQFGAAVATVNTPIEFAILADEAPLLQGLRNELRPLVEDVDVVLGGNFLKHFEPTFDFPGGRAVFRCAEDDPSCTIIPRCYPDERQPSCAGAEVP